MIHISRFSLADVLSASAVDADQLPTGIPFLNIRFRAKTNGMDAESLAGPGIYALSYKSSDSAGLTGIIYVGKYLGLRHNPFSGNVAKLRWWTHAGAFTMRGHKLHVARNTVAMLARELPTRAHAFIRFLEPSADIFKDRGNQAGLNRVRFALSNWERFGRASPANVLNDFSVTYLRLSVSRLSRPEVRRAVSQAEVLLIDELQPIGNGGIKGGRMPAEADFIERCQRLLLNLC